jgi:hypothetical protein
MDATCCPIPALRRAPAYFSRQLAQFPRLVPTRPLPMIAARDAGTNDPAQWTGIA